MPKPRIAPGVEHGTVKMWLTRRGFGFVVPDNGLGDGDVFVHVSELPRGLDRLIAGTPVSFRRRRSCRGPQATDVRVVSG